MASGSSRRSASIRASSGEIAAKKEGAEPPVHAVAVASDGYSLRFSLQPFVEPSTRAGRRYGKAAEKAEFVGVARVAGGEIVIAATREAHAMLCKVEEISFLSGPGRGVILIKLASPEDRVLGFIASTGDRDLMTVETSRGAEQTISTTKYDVTGRGGKGPRTPAARAVHPGRSGRRRKRRRIWESEDVNSQCSNFQRSRQDR